MRTVSSRGVRLLILFAVAALLATACGDDSGSGDGGGVTGDGGSDTTTQEMVDEGDRNLATEQDLIVRQYSEPVGFDPAFLFRIDTEMIALNIYSGLTKYDPLTAEPEPDLASSWEISDDGLTYTFELVDNAAWHDGEGVATSADVKYSYERIMDPDLGSPYRSEFSNIESIETPDDFTVVINLREPDGNFLYQVGNNHQGQIVREDVVESLGEDYARNPVGTGPFVFERWVPNSTLVLRAHDDYFLGRPTLDSITFNLITDGSAAETALLSGQVDLAAGMGSVSSEILDRVDSTPGFSFHLSEEYATSKWLFGPDFEPFQDARVRRAWALAMDEETNTASVMPRTAAPWTSILPPWMPVLNEDIEVIGFDPDEARELLAEAGYPDGFTVRFTTLNTDEIWLLRQSNLADVGIDLQFEVVEPAVFNQRRQTGDFELSHRTYPAVNPDTLLFGLLHPDSGLNSFGYDNPEMTETLEAARASLDEDERTELYHRAQEILAEDLPYVAANSTSNLWIGREGVRNVQVNRLASVDFFPVYIEAD